MARHTFSRCAVLSSGIALAISIDEWPATVRKAILDANKNGIIEKEECICGVDSEVFALPHVSRDMIDYSVLKKYEAIASSIAAAATSRKGDIDPQMEIDLLSDMLYQEPRGILGTWLGYTPDSYGTSFNKSYDMKKSANLVSTMDCGYAGVCDYADEHIMSNLTVRFIEQLGRNATLHNCYVYAKSCCPPVSYGDYLGTSEWAWLWNYFSPDPIFHFLTLPIRDYLYGNTTWLFAGRWSDPYVDPVAGVMVSFGVPYVTTVPLVGSVDPFIFREAGKAHPGFMKSFEGLYVMGVAGLDVRLSDVIMECADGFYSTYPTCSVCPSGTYRAGGDPGDTCLTCAPGYYASGNGSSACTPCSRGYFQSVSGKTSCDRCRPGTVQNYRSMSYCDVCQPGSASKEWNASTCDRCRIGWYATDSGKTGCSQCPEGMATGGLGSVFVQECVCAENTFLTAISQRCEQCPFGMTCNRGSLDPSFADLEHTPSLLPGYYSSVDEPLSVYSCTGTKSCPGGLPGTCGGGHIGRACHLCESGRYSSTEGDCKTCDRGSVGPIIAFCSIASIGVAMSHTAVNLPFLNTKSDSMVSGCLTSVIVTSVMSFNVYASLYSGGVSRMSNLFDISHIISLDSVHFKFPCFARSNHILLRFVFKLAAFPCAFLIVCFYSFLMKLTRWTRDYAFFSISSFINSGGFVFSGVFIAISLASLEGFFCSHNPNGKDTLISDPSVVCWSSHDHESLVVASIIAISVYPFSFLVFTGYCSWQYYALANRFGTKFTHSMRFLMTRWKPDQYYLGIVYALRNFALTIAPIIVPRYFDIQVILLHAIHLSWLFVQQSLRPWRFDIVNRFDAITSTTHIIVLTCIGILVSKCGDALIDTRRAEYVALGASVLVTILTVCAAALSLALKFRKLKAYGLFLCHCKGVDAIYARQIKLMLAMVTTRRVFLDVDSLECLDELGFLVRSCADNFIVMLSPETLNRFTSVAEIILAFRNHIPIIVTETQYVENVLCAEFLGQVSSMWDPDQIVVFSMLGIEASSDTESAYRFVATLPIIRILLDSSESAQIETVSRITSVAKGCRTEKREYKLDSKQVSYVVYDTSCFEKASCARILCMLMKSHGWNCSILDDERKVEDVPESVLLALVSRGFFMDPIGLGHACFFYGKGVPFTTIVSDEDLRRARPSKEHLKQVQGCRAFNEEQLTTLGRIAPSATESFITEVVVAIYAPRAASFNPRESEHILLHEVSTIVKRAKQQLNPLEMFSRTSRNARKAYQRSRDSDSEPDSPHLKFSRVYPH